MDEPSLGIARIIVNDIIRTIKEINKVGTTVLLIEQNGVKELAMSERAYLLQKGQIIASCTDNKPESKNKLIEVYMEEHSRKEEENGRKEF